MHDATVAAPATTSDLSKAIHISRLDDENSAEYHFNVNPAHSPPYLDTLNELAIKTATGK
jgi:hypothetical protein